MGGVDKGLQTYGSSTLVANAIARLRPQVGAVAISANRHPQRYAEYGVAVHADGDGGAFNGPLAGMLAGLKHCATPYLAMVPCDAPRFPLDLVERLANALDAASPNVELAVASTHANVETGNDTNIEATFCLLRCELASVLARDLARGERKASRWLLQQGHVVVRFADALAFANANTLDELERLQPT